MSDGALIERLCRDAGIELPERWSDYFAVATKWGAKTDLTSARTGRELAEILFLDAAQLLGAGWVALGSSFLDVGAGVGAPSLPILAAGDSLRGVLVEPRRIRTAFLRTAIGSLGLGARVTVLETRVDPDAPEVPGAPFDIALSRATFAPADWMRVGAQLANEVWVLTAGADLAGSADIELVRRIDYRVPSSDAPRTVLAYRRRRAGMI